MYASCHFVGEIVQKQIWPDILWGNIDRLQLVKVEVGEAQRSASNGAPTPRARSKWDQ